MSRHLMSADKLIEAAEKEQGAILRSHINAYFAEKVALGEVVHNVETDVFCDRAKADEQFIADAAAAYARMLDRRDRSQA